MNNRIALVFRYLSYLRQAKTRHGVHSPFVYTFIDSVLKDERNFYAFEAIEQRREELLADARVLEVTDFGAGSQSSLSRHRPVSEIARHAAKPARFGRLFFRMAMSFNPFTIVELGTSLGISAAYWASWNHSCPVYTLEGCPETAAIARETFQVLDLPEVRLLEGPFDQTFPALIDQLPHLDMVFIDGNHRKEATLQYFNWCLSKVTESSILVFDDIHWTSGMQEAWQEICQHPSVTLSLDLFFIGIVFFRKDAHEKQQLVLRY